MITRSAEYALRAALCLGKEDRAGGAALTTQQIASVAQVPTGYLAKILRALGRAGLVSAQRGLNGGYVLSRPPGQITLLDVVLAVAKSRRVLECPLELASHRHKLCPLHRRLDEAAAHVEQALRGATLAELLSEAEKCGTSPLCDSSKPMPAAGPCACVRREVPRA
jgi:Rrf2 family protein